MRCSDCKYWDAVDKYEPPIVGFNKRNKKHCGLYVYGMNSESAPSYLDAGDFASSDGSLWTEPDFGCTRYEPR